MSDVIVSGPLFEGKIDVKAGMRDAMTQIADRGLSLVRSHLAQRGHGPSRYGHVADAPRREIKTLPSGEMGARVFLAGPSKFLGPMLEGGTRPHRIPKIRIKGRGNRRQLSGSRYPLVFPVGGALLFRQVVDHPGSRAFHWREQSQIELENDVPGILERAFAAHLAP